MQNSLFTYVKISELYNILLKTGIWIWNVVRENWEKPNNYGKASNLKIWDKLKSQWTQINSNLKANESKFPQFLRPKPLF